MSYCNKCNFCTDCYQRKDECRCPDQILGITNLYSDRLAYLTFNDGGRSVNYDYEPMIKQTETDTSVSIDALGRVLKYMAERHTDTISAKELGSILHLADIGDVDITELKDNSILAYRKDSNCGEGCEGINNAWYAHNALEHLTDSVQYLMGFDADGAPITLNAPVHPDQYYQLGWNGGNKVSFSQPVEVASPPLDEDGKCWRVYVDPNTHQLVFRKENP